MTAKEKELGDALERTKRLREMETELFERLGHLKTQRLALPRLVELPVPFPLPLPRLAELTERRRMIPT